VSNHWKRHAPGATGLGNFLGAQGFRARAFKTPEALLKGAINIFGLPSDTPDCKSALNLVKALGIDGRRERARAAWDAGRTPTNNKMLQRRIGPKTSSRRLKNADDAHPQRDQARIVAFYDSAEWRRLRYDFIRANKQHCQCCGLTPADGIKLVIDHIKPLRFYWHLRLDARNLQVLCDACNVGKGSRDDTDFRLLNAKKPEPAKILGGAS
jgi:5-methylcytosine-specific restriction endonuclease McrA